MVNSKDENFESFIKNDVVSKIKKVSGKHSPIAENVENMPKSLSVKSVHDLNKKLKNFYLITLKNYKKKPKFRYFLTVSFANNSSDLLVQLARDIILKQDLKLIQYAIYPKTLRIQLLCLKEIHTINHYTTSIKLLKSVRKEFREKLVKVKDLVQDFKG
ncbi:MAG: hypothetical protein ACW98D_06975 [Promethearchaeota archaeon]|jgi:hypothetical protein